MSHHVFSKKKQLQLLVRLSFYNKFFIKYVDVVSLICPWEYMTFVIHEFVIVFTLKIKHTIASLEDV